MPFDLNKFFADSEPRENQHGAVVRSVFLPSDRYVFDLNAPDGWFQYDTRDDAWYFGQWYNPTTREFVCYAEGDWSWTQCPTQESWDATVKALAEFYGNPPPYAIGFDADGTETHYFDPNARP